MAVLLTDTKSMTREELWLAYAAKNPAFLGDNSERVSLTVGGLKKLFVQTWDRAHEKGVANGRALEQMERKSAPNSSIFDQVFGKH